MIYVYLIGGVLIGFAISFLTNEYSKAGMILNYALLALLTVVYNDVREIKRKIND